MGFRSVSLRKYRHSVFMQVLMLAALGFLPGQQLQLRRPSGLHGG